MLDFLELNYPISRIKYLTRFKRGIIFDDGRTYVLSDQTHHATLKIKLIQVLKKVFYCDESKCITMVNNFLNSK